MNTGGKILKRLDPGSSTLARDDTALWIGMVCFGAGCLFLKTGSRFARIYADKRHGLARYWAAEVCSAEATELPVWKRPPVSVANGLCHPWALNHGSIVTDPARTPAARDDAVYSLVWSISVRSPVSISGASASAGTAIPMKLKDK